MIRSALAALVAFTAASAVVSAQTIDPIGRIHRAAQPLNQVASLAVPVIDRLAKTGNDRAVILPGTRLTHADRNAPELKGDLDFSFSGLKTAVLRYVKEQPPLSEA